MWQRTCGRRKGPVRLCWGSTPKYTLSRCDSGVTALAHQTRPRHELCNAVNEGSAHRCMHTPDRTHGETAPCKVPVRNVSASRWRMVWAVQSPNASHRCGSWGAEWTGRSHFCNAVHPGAWAMRYAWKHVLAEGRTGAMHDRVNTLH